MRDPAACAGPRRSARRPAGRRQFHSTLDRRGHIRRLCCRVPRLVRSNRNGIDPSLIIVCRRSSAAARMSCSASRGKASSKTRIPCDHTQRHYSSASGRRPGPAESGTVHTVTEAVRAAVGAAAQVAAAVGVLSGRRSDGNSSLALSRANAWLPNHAGNERPYWWSLAPEPGSDLSHDCPARGRGPGDDSGGRPPLGHSYIRVACTTGGARRPTRRPVR